MTENQPTGWVKTQLKNTKLGDDLVGKYTPKKDLNRKATAYIEKHVTVKSIVRFETCSEFLLFLTNDEMSVKRLHKTYSCENRF